MFLFPKGKRPIDIAIELSLPSIEVENVLQEYLVSNNLGEPACGYSEIKNNLDLFLRLFHLIKKNNVINLKAIKKVLKYSVDDLPTLESKFYSLANIVLDLEIRKKELSAQLIDLGNVKRRMENG